MRSRARCFFFSSLFWVPTTRGPQEGRRRTTKIEADRYDEENWQDEVIIIVVSFSFGRGISKKSGYAQCTHYSRLCLGLSALNVARFWKTL